MGWSDPSERVIMIRPSPRNMPNKGFIQDDSNSSIEDIDIDLQGISPEVFDDLQELQSLSGKVLNEYGEIEDPEDVDNVDELNDVDHVSDSLAVVNDQDTSKTDHTQSCHNTGNFAQPCTNTQTKPQTSSDFSWSKRGILSGNETDHEFELFNIYRNCGGGRSVSYITQLTNLPSSAVTKIAQKNNWVRRAADYDRYVMAQKLKEAESARHKRHMQKLELYRQQQETLGHQLSVNAARIAFLANKKLGSMLDSEQEIDIRDMPSLLNTASKLAEVGKNLQSSALGVDQLLAAIEESEMD